MNTNFEGTFVAGTCHGFLSTPWKNNPEKFNHRLAISRTFTDQWGIPTTQLTEIDISLKSVERIKKQVEMLKGQQVMIKVIPMAKKGGSNGAFLTYFAPDDSQLLPQPKLTSVDSKAA